MTTTNKTTHWKLDLEPPKVEPTLGDLIMDQTLHGTTLIEEEGRRIDPEDLRHEDGKWYLHQDEKDVGPFVVEDDGGGS